MTARGGVPTLVGGSGAGRRQTGTTDPVRSGVTIVAGGAGATQFNPADGPGTDRPDIIVDRLGSIAASASTGDVPGTAIPVIETRTTASPASRATAQPLTDMPLTTSGTRVVPRESTAGGLPSPRQERAILGRAITLLEPTEDDVEGMEYYRANNGVHHLRGPRVKRGKTPEELEAARLLEEKAARFRARRAGAAAAPTPAVTPAPAETRRETPVSQIAQSGTTTAGPATRSPETMTRSPLPGAPTSPGATRSREPPPSRAMPGATVKQLSEGALTGSAEGSERALILGARTPAAHPAAGRRVLPADVGKALTAAQREDVLRSRGIGELSSRSSAFRD